MNAVIDNASYALVAGLGRSGFSAARYLRATGWRVAVTDSRERPPQLAELRALEPPIPVSLGRLDETLLEGAQLLVASPGIALSEPLFVAARARGVPIVGDIELFARAQRRGAAAGITGTNGKSTVTTLVGRMAERAGRHVRVGGNLGQPALELLDDPRTDLYVLELSSFQLETTESLALKAATVLNVTPDHMDRYRSVQEYAAAKARIFAHCETCVINLDDPYVARMPRPGQRCLGFSLRPGSEADYALLAREGGSGADTPHGLWLARRGEPLLALDNLKIAGLHNAANALAALALGEALELPLHAMLEELAGFSGLPHRTEFIAQLQGVRFVNDSKGTNVGATLAAVQGLPGTLVLIAGGDGKGQDFTPLAQALRGKVRHVVLIGRDAAALARVLEGVCSTERCDSLEQAVRAAARAAQPGDTVLLSPACASFDMFH
ncbi:MAG TPA: UDP-N-acetylmuramoyl-L-alanine--D-glutamate ligase, partial [Steroidobacteraceae bacterium]